MLVHVKTPLIDVQVSGMGADLVIDTLRRTYGQVDVSDDDEALPIRSTQWYQSMKSAISPADILATYRENSGLTLDLLSEKSGISKSHLSEMENGKRTMGPRIARKLATAFGCDYRCFFID